MNEPRRHVLVIGADQAVLDRVAPMLHREEFDVHTVAPSRFVLDLVASTPFEVLLIMLPSTRLGLDEMVSAIRREGSSCRRAGVLVLAEPGLVDEAVEWLDGGVNRVVSLDWPEARIWQALADLLDVAERVDLRVLLEAELEVDGQASTLVQTRNVSRSGLLVACDEPVRVGSRFDFSFYIRGAPQPVLGTAEVVRLVQSERGKVQGFGARFVSLASSGRELLARYIDDTLARGAQRPARR